MLKTLGLTVALCAPAVALAEPVTRTVTIDTPRYEGTRTTTRDREAGTMVRDTEVTRRSDGATASRHVERQRTENGFTVSGNATAFNGATRSFQVTQTGRGRFLRPRPHRPHRRGR
jgi:hypothetical protein